MATKDARATTSSPLRYLFIGVLALYGIALALYWLLWLTVGDAVNTLALLHNLAPYYFLPVIVGLPLALLLRAKRTFFLYLLLGIAGFLWFGVVLLPSEAPAASDDPLRVVTFNVYPYNEQLDTAQDWLLRQDADILALQEIGAPLPQIEAAYPYQSAQPMVNGHAIFSRYPILNASDVTLGDTPHQRVVLDIEGSEVVLYNVHLYMPFRENDRPLWLRYDETRRNQQIRELRQYAANETAPLIIAGDFNMSEYSPIYDTLAADLTDAYRTLQWGIGATWPGGESEELPGALPRLVRLDYVWHNDFFETTNALVGLPLGSDHLPLLVDLEPLP